MDGLARCVIFILCTIKLGQYCDEGNKEDLDDVNGPSLFEIEFDPVGRICLTFFNITMDSYSGFRPV